MTETNDARSQLPLGLARRGYSGVIELGFVEGARVEVLHEGIVGRDPIAVRVENVTIAVRRREAMAIIVA